MAQLSVGWVAVVKKLNQFGKQLEIDWRDRHFQLRVRL